MLLTISTTHRPATDLGYLVGKHPDRVQRFELPFGAAHVAFPHASEERCTMAMVLDLDPLELVRSARKRRNDDAPLTQYVNDRPYVASSFMSVAITRVLGSALSGSSRERAELAESAIPLEVTLAAVPARGGERLVRDLFEPLGYAVDVTAHPMDAHFAAWGTSPYVDITLTITERLARVLEQVYVLLPVLDDDKHYFVGDDEIDKLLARGGDWLAAHPKRDAIVSRALKRQRRLTQTALSRLAALDDASDELFDASTGAADEARLEKPVRLNTRRMDAVVAEVEALGARTVVDVGCGEGKLLRRLRKREHGLTRLVGMDVSSRVLDRAATRLGLDGDRPPPSTALPVELIHGSLTYRDERLAGFDVACVVEVIEHLDPWRLDAFEDALFAAARPGAVVLTTPNIEYNVRFDGLVAGRFRHRDHRFEWTRTEFRTWADGVCARHGYHVRFAPVGDVDPEVGSPTQMAVFTRTVGDTIS